MRPPVLLSLNTRPSLPEAMSPGLSVSDQQRLRQKSEKLCQENEQLRQENEQLRQENEQLRRKDEQLRQENDVLRADAAGHEIELEKLRQENNALRADAAKHEVELGKLLRIERETFAKQLEEARSEATLAEREMIEYLKVRLQEERDLCQVAEDDKKQMQESTLALLDTVEIVPSSVVEMFFAEALKIPSLVVDNGFSKFENEYRREYRERFAGDDGELSLELAVRMERLVKRVLLSAASVLDKELEESERARVEGLRFWIIYHADNWHRSYEMTAFEKTFSYPQVTPAQEPVAGVCTCQWGTSEPAQWGTSEPTRIY